MLPAQVPYVNLFDHTHGADAMVMMIAVLGSVSTIHGRSPNAFHARIAARSCCLSTSIKARVAKWCGLFAPDITTSGIRG